MNLLYQLYMVTKPGPMAKRFLHLLIKSGIVGQGINSLTTYLIFTQVLYSILLYNLYLVEKPGPGANSILILLLIPVYINYFHAELNNDGNFGRRSPQKIPLDDNIWFIVL